MVRKYGAIAVLLAAVCFYALAFVPAAFYAGINSDELQVSEFYHDIFEAGHSVSGWIMPASSDLFPDWSICFLLNYLLHSGLKAEATLQVLFLITWMALLFAGYIAAGGKRPAIFVSLLVLLTVLVARSGLSHIGAMLNAFATLDLILFIWRKYSLRRVAALALVVFLGADSDPLFLVICLGPALLALAVESYLHPASRAVAWRLIPVMILSAIAGYVATPWLFPVPSSRGSYTRFRPENILTCAEGIWKDLSISEHPWFVALFVLNVAILIGGALTVLAFRGRLRGSSRLVVFLFVYSFALVAINWTALLLSNGWSIRYVYFPLIWPCCVASGFLAATFPRGPWSGRILALAVAGYTVFAGMHPPRPSPQYLDAFRRAADLRALMAQEHMQRGFSEYWIANVTTYLSGQTVIVRPMAGTDFYHWISNTQWIEGDTPGAPPPKFRYIVMPKLDPVALRGRYGPPDRVVKDSLNEEIWIYSDAHAISYSHIFGGLGNRYTYPNADVALFTAAALNGETGTIEGTKRIAHSGDKPGCITFGPYLHILPGRYQADYSYTYLKPPAAHQALVFDCVLRLRDEDYLDKTPVPYSDALPKILSRKIVVPPHDPGALIEMRLHYPGSGDVQVDSLKLTYLGP